MKASVALIVIIVLNEYYFTLSTHAEWREEKLRKLNYNIYVRMFAIPLSLLFYDIFQQL